MDPRKETKKFRANVNDGQPPWLRNLISQEEGLRHLKQPQRKWQAPENKNNNGNKKGRR